MSLTTDVIDLLAELGEDEDQVAQSLSDRGIKGFPGKECNCPIYNYLASKDIAVARVDSVYVRLADGAHVPVPPAVSEFIDAFDHDGAWDELVPEVSS